MLFCLSHPRLADADDVFDNYELGLKDSYGGLIVANLSFSVPFCTWLMMGYLRSISTEIEEASMIDGCYALAIALAYRHSALGAGISHSDDLYLQQRLERVYLCLRSSAQVMPTA